MVGKNIGQNKLDLNKIEREKTKEKPIRESNQSNEKCGFWIVAQQANY